jgi:p24 family protein gamma-5
MFLQVLRGGDGMAGFAVRHPNGQIVHAYQWKPNAEYQDQTSSGGYYAVCVDNQFSRFAAKLVNLYITVIRYNYSFINNVFCNAYFFRNTGCFILNSN